MERVTVQAEDVGQLEHGGRVFRDQFERSHLEHKEAPEELGVGLARIDKLGGMSTPPEDATP